MNRSFSTRKIVQLVIAMAVAAACAVMALQQNKRNQPPAADPTAIPIVIHKASGPACQITVVGGTADLRHKVALHLNEGQAHSDSIDFPGPSYTIDTVSVSSDGETKAHEVNATVHAGEAVDIKISDTLELRSK